MKSAAILTLWLAGLGAVHGHEAYRFSAVEVNRATEQHLQGVLKPLLAGPFAESESWPKERTRQIEQVFRRVKNATQRMSWVEGARPQALSLVLVHHRIPLALSSAGGKVVVSTGFLETYAPDEDQLALIFGHEMAHSLCEHERIQLSAVWRRNAPQRLRARDALEFLQVEPMVQLQIAPLVIAHERSADLVGLQLAALAGYDPQKAIAFFDTAGRLQGSGIHETAHDSPETRKAALAPMAGLLNSPQTMKTLLSCAG